MEKPADNHDSHAGSDTDSEPIDWLEAEVLMLGNVKSNLSKDELDDTIQSVKAHFKGFLISREKLVKILGYAYEKFLSRKEDICEEIKNTLAEEIACHLISNRDIERYCFDEWKKKTKPKKSKENEKMSFSNETAWGRNEIQVTSSAQYDSPQYKTEDYESKYCSDPLRSTDNLGNTSGTKRKDRILIFSYSIPFEALQFQIEQISKRINVDDKVWLCGKVDLETNEIIKLSVNMNELA